MPAIRDSGIGLILSYYGDSTLLDTARAAARRRTLRRHPVSVKSRGDDLRGQGRMPLRSQSWLARFRKCHSPASLPLTATS